MVLQPGSLASGPCVIASEASGRRGNEEIEGSRIEDRGLEGERQRDASVEAACEKGKLNCGIGRIME